MPYLQLFYHMVWSTKQREPLLTPEVEPIVHGFLRAKAIGLGAVVWALDGVLEHVHMVASLPPKIAPAIFIGQVKGVAATKFNKLGRGVSLFWQEEYGIFSCDRKCLHNYVAYVERQKEHHAQGTTIPILERASEGGVQVVREPVAIYAVGEPTWREELLALEPPA